MIDPVPELAGAEGRGAEGAHFRRQLVAADADEVLAAFGGRRDLRSVCVHGRGRYRRAVPRRQRKSRPPPLSEAEIKEEKRGAARCPAIPGEGVQRLEIMRAEIAHEEGDAEQGGEAGDEPRPKRQRREAGAAGLVQRSEE